MEEKIICIKENKDSAIAALNCYLDSIYNLTDKYYDKNLNENGELVQTLKKELTSDKKAETFIKDLNKDSIEYEKVRKKLTENDFNLSLPEIARIGLAYVFINLTFEKQIKAIQEAQKKTIEIINVLNMKSENIDFSKET